MSKTYIIQEAVQFINIILFLASLMTGMWWLTGVTGTFLTLWFAAKWWINKR